MSIRGECVVTSVTDPYLTMAVEQRLYDSLSPDRVVLFLWTNRDSIITGRFQNPWAECDVPGAQEAGIPVLRRISGGGTVFHDLGNLNYSIITPRALYDQSLSFSVILKALNALGLDAEIRNKSDIVLDGKKISGNAFKVGSDKALHHGTLLVRSDIPRLKSFLTPCIRPSSSKAITSRPTPVMNLCENLKDLSVEHMMKGLTVSFAAVYGQAGCELTEFTEDDCKQREDVSAAAEHFREWDWVFGRTPDFTFIQAGLEVTVESGKIRHIVNGKGAAVYPELLDRPFSPVDFTLSLGEPHHETGT